MTRRHRRPTRPTSLFPEPPLFRSLLKNARVARGQTILTGADTAEIIGTGKVEGVELKDGTLIPASLVVMAVGIRPSTQLARDAGLAVNRKSTRLHSSH